MFKVRRRDRFTQKIDEGYAESVTHSESQVSEIVNHLNSQGEFWEYYWEPCAPPEYVRRASLG